eukprot:GHVP01025987.1.p1 GENE.GHVP01025987.1~~GHVP01025987.1.p1  ORF type:complete len:169 (+),score=9.55 GHVP01025987.1:947-1453(+)
MDSLIHTLKNSAITRTTWRHVFGVLNVYRRIIPAFASLTTSIANHPCISSHHIRRRGHNTSDILPFRKAIQQQAIIHYTRGNSRRLKIRPMDLPNLRAHKDSHTNGWKISNCLDPYAATIPRTPTGHPKTEDKVTRIPTNIRHSHRTSNQYGRYSNLEDKTQDVQEQR